ncbi:MAG: AAA family ATPase [Clostridia bacterium]|nr:AAA family ATPase [Clostridia bacterium]
MKILELNIIEFGGLKNKKLDFSNSLNLILGDNESGKSTVARFIKFMFYGLPRKTQTNFDRDLGLNRDSNRAEGHLTLTHNGEVYKIERSAIMGARRQFADNVRILRLPLGEELPSSKEPWEIFLGVDSDVFESSCFIRQLRCGEINGEKAAGAIENMLSSADESIDVSSTTAKLEALRRTYRHKTGSGGSIPRLSEEISVLRSKLRTATENYLRLGELTARLSDNTALRDSISAEIQKSDILIEQMKGAERLSEFSELKNTENELEEIESKRDLLIKENIREQKLPSADLISTLKRASDNYIEALTDANKAKEKENSLRSSVPYDTALIIGAKEIEKDGGASAITDKAKALNTKKKTSKLVAFILLSIGIMGGASLVTLSFIFAQSFIIFLTSAIGVASVFIPSSIGLFILSSKKAKARNELCEKYGCSFDQLPSAIALFMAEKQKKDKYEEELRRTEEISAISMSRADEKREILLSSLRAIGISPSDDILGVAENEYKRSTLFLNALSELQSEILILKAKIDHIKKGLEGYSEEDLRRSIPAEILDIDPAEMEKALRVRSFNANKLSILERDIIDTTNKIAALKAVDSDPLAISDRITQLEAKYKADDEFCSALDLAIEEITKAGEAIRAGVAPTIANRAGEMIDYISGGKYEKLYADKKMELTAEDTNGNSCASYMFSGGTKDCVYLCLRISLMMQLFENSIPPLVLDEAFSQLDDTRAEATVKLLHKLSEEDLQCIIFSCHSREEEICNRLGLTANIIRL